MALSIYLDDCADSKGLVRLLTRNGHDVQRPEAAGLKGADDEVHLAHARATGRILLTKNPKDFESLTQANQDHPGILAIYQNNRPSDMSDADVALAIENMIQANCLIAGQFVALNWYHYDSPKSETGTAP